MKPNQKPTPISQVVLWVVIGISFALINLLLLVLTRSTYKTTTLLQKELGQLRQNTLIGLSDKELTAKYQKEIDLFAAVFPDEKTISALLQTLETEIGTLTSDFSVKFNAVNPIKEQEYLFVPLTIILRTDMPTLETLLDRLEKLPYMTHITAISARTPDGFDGVSAITISLKAYVKDPFTEK